jgi:fido (protein-threonine AMPylation protein)
LNRAEQANIVRARVWARTARSIAMPKMLSRDFLEELHRLAFIHPFSNGNGLL